MNSISRHFLKEIFRIIEKFVFSPNAPYNIKIKQFYSSAIEYLHEFNRKKKIDQKCSRVLVIEGLQFKSVE